MAHYDDGAVEVAYGGLEHVLGAHVQVVGGLVEDEEVHRLEQQLDHGQAAALAAREHLDLLVRRLAAKHERAQYVADAQADVALGHAVDGVEHRQLAVEQLGLVLRVVADFDVMAQLEVALKGYFAHDTLDEGGLAFAVLADKGHLFAALDGEVHVVEHAVVAVVLAHVLADDGIVARARAGRELQAQAGGVDLVNLDGHNLFQLLDAALHLYGLGGLVAEALNEVLDVGNFLLLVLVGADLLLAAFGAQLDKGVVGHAVVRGAAAGNFQRAVGHVVQEGAVVAHQNHGARAAGQELLEPLDALDVEVVGGLVKQQHVGALQQQLGQLDTHAPAAGKFARGAVKVGRTEAQTLERALQRRLIVHAAHHLEALALVAEGFHQLQVVGALVVGAAGELAAEGLHALLLAADVRKGLFGLLAYGVAVAQYHHLRQVADGAVLLDAHRARRGHLLAGKYLQQGRFAGPVLADQSDAVFGVDDERHVLKKRTCAEFHAKFFY